MFFMSSIKVLSQSEFKMKLTLHLCLTLTLFVFSQSTFATNLFAIAEPKNLENIHVVKLGSDQHSTEFLIFIKQQVPLHYHKEHTETVMFISGSATMQLGDKTLEIIAGDYIRIPAGTHHSVTVTSKQPLKVLSIQAPEFLGEDRVMIE